MILYFGSVVCGLFGVVVVMISLPRVLLRMVEAFVGFSDFLRYSGKSAVDIVDVHFPLAFLLYQTSVSCLVSCVLCLYYPSSTLYYYTSWSRQYTCVVIPPAPLITSAGFYRGNESFVTLTALSY
jgi:hypothetical protein